jgi:hypothetical protein
MPRPALPSPAEAANLSRRTGHHGRVPEVDDDQLAALRRLRAAFGPIEVVKVVRNYPVISNDPEDDRLEGTGQLGGGARMADPAADDP